MGPSSGQGNNIKPNANSLIGVNGPLHKRVPSTGRNGVNLETPQDLNDNFYKNSKRAQSLERSAAVHSSGNPGLNSLGRNPMAAQDFNYAPDVDISFQKKKYEATGSVQTQRKRRQIMHDNLTNSRGTSRI